MALLSRQLSALKKARTRAVSAPEVRELIAAVGGGTDLSYTAATRALLSSTGTDVTLPLVTSTNAGLAPASGGGTSNFLRADLTWASPGSSLGSFTKAQLDTAVSDGNVLYVGDAPTAHTHPASAVTDLAATVKAYTLDEFANPVSSLDFAQQQTLQFVIENRTSDPGAPVAGQLWLRTDL